jgi:hypothetical protein
MRTIAIFLFVGTFGLAACDYVEDPTPPGQGGGGGSTAFSIVLDTSQLDLSHPPAARNVMLEDITGHRCNNCPRAARIAQALKDDLYGESLIIVGVHAGSFAPPYPPIGDGQYDTDHRTEAGIAYQQAYQVTFFPAGLVNRRVFDGSRIVSEGSWGASIAGMVNTPTPFDITIEPIVVNDGRVSTTITMHVTENVSGNYKMVVYLLEDPVVDWQLDAEATPPDVPDYAHPHVLRANLNGIWGTPVIAGGAPDGRVVSLTINNFALSPAWDVNNLSLVAWVYDETTEEVLQAKERKFPQ